MRSPLRAAEPGAPSLAGVTWRAVSVPPGTRSGFTRLESARIGLAFTNRLEGDLSLTNAVAHNGSGVALGDVDGDGRPDLYLCALEGPNRLFRNLGDFRFAEVELGAAACANQLSTGATFADVDGDADLDLLVNGIRAGTRLFLNDGRGRWTEVLDSGLSRDASAMSLALADIDGDGDLDLYCAHYLDMLALSDPTTRLTTGTVNGRSAVVKVNDEPGTVPPWKDRFEVLADGSVHELPEFDGVYRNDGRGHFTRVTHEPGLFRDENNQPMPADRAWGLGAAFRDINGDGAPDLFVCNDNASPDRVWINTGDGHFRLIASSALRHASRSSMGIDFADLDRDGRDDFLVLDMLARDPARRIQQLVRSLPDPMRRTDPRERPLYNRNTLFFGRDDGSFVEAALWAGVAATDWSWCPVFLDVDLDGYEDLLVTNGFEQDVMDQDSTDALRQRSWTPQQLRRYRQVHPRWPTANAAFRNRGNGQFEAKASDWGFDLVGISHGMALADLDGDGDLDAVVNNLNAAVAVYRNEATAARVAVHLKGRAPNTEGIGARVSLVGEGVVQSQEFAAGGRYLSDDDTCRVFAVPAGRGAPLHFEVRWRSGVVTTVDNVQANRVFEVSEPSVRVESPPASPPAAESESFFTDVSPLLDHAHRENVFDDEARQPLLPRKLSRLGPALAWGDLNGDGWEDLVVTAARDGALGVLVNQTGKGFQPLRGIENTPVDQGACVLWTDAEGRSRVVVTLSNDELAPGSETQLQLLAGGVPPQRLAAGPSIPGPLVTADFDGDGVLDLFMGGRALPGRYPEPAPSALWWGSGTELRRDPARDQPFATLGLVTGAVAADFDGDGFLELAVATEWGPLRVFRHLGTRAEETTARWGLADSAGLWTSVAAGDFDGDGRVDLVAGNWGRNTAYEVFHADALGLFYAMEPGESQGVTVEAWRQGPTWRPVRHRQQLAAVLPDLAQRFSTHADFAAASIAEVLGPRFAAARRVEAREFESAVFLNRGSRFQRQPLPRAAQLAPAASVHVADLDGDGFEDLFLCQNFFDTLSDLHRDDGGQGLWLRGLGNGEFVAQSPRASGIRLEGEQRAAAFADFDHDGRIDFAVAQNNGPTRLFANRRAKPGLRVTLVGSKANPRGIGARLRLVFEDGTSGPVRTVVAGSGAGSQDAPTQVLGWTKRPASLWVRWPEGAEQTYPIADASQPLRLRSPASAAGEGSGSRGRASARTVPP